MMFKITKIKKADSPRTYNPLGVLVLVGDDQNIDNFFKTKQIEKPREKFLSKLRSKLKKEGAEVILPLIINYDGTISTHKDFYSNFHVGYVVAYRNEILNFLDKKGNFSKK